MATTELVNVLDKIDPKLVKNYGITEAFVVNGELHVTSNYTLSPELFSDLEKLICG